MYVWDHKNRRHGALARRKRRPKAYASAFLSRDAQEHEEGLQDEEIRRQEMEDAEVDIKQEEVERLIMEYMQGPEGKKELEEVAENLRHWKENCAALGYESDGEKTPLASLGTADGSGDVADLADNRAEMKKEERRERMRKRGAREVFDMFDVDGSHTICIAEMNSLLKEMCIPMKRPQLKELMRAIDTDGSGEIDFDEFYQWYKDNASAARHADKTQTVGLFATKLIKGLTGFTFRMEALRVIVAHAQSQVEKREREQFRLTRPPRFVCDVCGETFASAREKKKHHARRKLNHDAWEAAERGIRLRFHPVAVLLDHTTPPLVEGAPQEPFRSADAPTARKKRLRRLVFSDKFYILYGGVGWGGMGSGDVERVEEKRWVNKPHPRVADPDDRRGDQLRRGQSVEGIDPSDSRGKVPLEVTRGGLAPNWGGVRRGRVMRRVWERESTGLQHILLRLTQEKARATNTFMADDALARARVVFRWEGWSSQQVTLHGEFNRFKAEGMGEDQTEGQIGHEASHSLSPGTYKYYFMVDGHRRVDDSLPVIGDESGDLFNVVTVTNQHLGKEGERALSSVQLRRQQKNYSSILLTSSALSAFDPLHTDRAHDLPKRHQDGDDDSTRDGPGEVKAESVAQAEDLWVNNLGADAKSDADAIANKSPSSAEATWTSHLRRIDLSRHQISDDGAVALALALRRNIRVEELDLSFNRISGEGIAALASSLGDPCCRVMRLRLTQNGIGRRGGEHLGMMLNGGQGNSQWGQVPCLRELNLADNKLGDDGAEDLSTGLLGHPCLETLILDGNEIGHDGTQSLCDSLLRNSSLTTLSLRRNCMLADSAERLNGMLLRNGAIETLDLGYNPLGAEGLRRLSAFLFKNTGVEYLGLRGCELQSNGIKSGIYSLGRGLCVNRALKTIDLAANELGEYAGQELAHALVKNKVLMEMDLTGNYIPDEWLRENHKICSEVYGFLPSLGESLRLNLSHSSVWYDKAGSEGGGKEGNYRSPRTVRLEKIRAREARATERKQRGGKRRKKEAHARHSTHRRHRRERQRHEELKKSPSKEERESRKGRGEDGELCILEGKGEQCFKLKEVTSGMKERKEEPRAASAREDMAALAEDTENQVGSSVLEQSPPPFEDKRRRSYHRLTNATRTEIVPTPTAAKVTQDSPDPGRGDGPEGSEVAYCSPRSRRKSFRLPPSPSPPQKKEGDEEEGEVERERWARKKKRTKRDSAAQRAAAAAGNVAPSATDCFMRKPDEAVSSQNTFATGAARRPGAAESGSVSASSNVAADREMAEGEAEGGVRRIPGVWTRRGLWLATSEHGEDRARMEGRKAGDRQRQSREDEVVRKAGQAKRQELLEYLTTSDGQILVVRVAKLLVHGEREEARAAKSARKAEKHTLRLRKKEEMKRLREENSGVKGIGGPLTLSRASTLWRSGLWARKSKSMDLGDEKMVTDPSLRRRTSKRAAPAPWSATQSPGQQQAMAATATAKVDWESLSNVCGSQGTIGVDNLESLGTSSFLPSVVAAAAMEDEDREGIKRALGQLREDMKAWDMKHRRPFLEVFARFDPEGRGEMLASEVGDLMAQLLLPEAVRPREVAAITAELIKSADHARKMEKIDREKAARRSGLYQAPPPPRPFTPGSGGKTVSMAHIWRWHRKEHLQWKPSFRTPTRKELRRLASEQRRRGKSGEISRDWARRVILAVGEREACLRAAEVFRGRDPPRFVCPECHELGYSTMDDLDEHLRDTSWHEMHAALQERFEENADIVAVARRAGGAGSFPEYFYVARDLPEETELQVREAPSEISRPLGTITFDMLVLALGEEGEWLKINYMSHRGVYVKHTITDPNKGHRRKVVITRMTLPAARSAAKVAASTAHLSATAAVTVTSTLVRPITLAASGLSRLGYATMSTLEAIAYTVHYGTFRPPREPESLAPGTAVFKPRVVRFALPRVFCHARGLPPDAMLKVRTEPNSSGSSAEDGGDTGEGGEFWGTDGGRGHVLGRVGADQCVIALATSGDWLQVRYKKYEAAWMLMTYRGRKLLAPLPDVHPGVNIVVAGEGIDGGGGDSTTFAKGGNGGGVRESPFPMPAVVLEKREGEEKREAAAAAAEQLEGTTTVGIDGDCG